MSGSRILVVDDEPQMVRFLRPALEASGYQVLHAGTGHEALRLMANAAPDLTLLDLGLPDMDGKDVIGKARQFTQTPIVVLSARDREVEKIAALDLGANDYVEKPFAIGELLARLRAALRHAKAGAAPKTRVEIDGLTIDMDKRLVARGGQAIKLTPREYDLLCALAGNAGRVMTHGHILTAVWGPAHKDDTQYLRVFIGQLRNKIERDPSAPAIIRTESGIGYRFAEEVQAAPTPTGQETPVPPRPQ
jgi:two-component system KDP operon response regulator KdpE